MRTRKGLERTSADKSAVGQYWTKITPSMTWRRNTCNLMYICFVRSLMESCGAIGDGALLIDVEKNDGRFYDVLKGGKEVTKLCGFLSSEQHENILRFSC